MKINSLMKAVDEGDPRSEEFFEEAVRLEDELRRLRDFDPRPC